MHPDPTRTIHVTASRPRLATARDVAIILVCAAILLGAFAELLLPARAAPPARPAERSPAAASVSM